MGTITGWGNVGYFSEFTFYDNCYLFFWGGGFRLKEFDSFVACQGTLQTFFRRHMCPSSVMLCAMLLITMTTRSPLPCSVPVMRKEALMLVRSVFFSSLCVLVHKSSFSVPSHSFVLFDLIIDRGTAAVLSWPRTVCQRPAGIVCLELWAGERVVPWPRNPASTPKCPDFFPGYLQPWGWGTQFLVCFLLVIIPGESLVLQMWYRCVLFSSTNRAITTYQGSTNWPGHETGHEHLSRPCKGQKGLSCG